MMNKRIKALGRQASKLALEEYHTRQKTEFVGDVIYSDIYDQKFAELIVKECVDVISDAVNHREPASTYAHRILNYFGINQ
jgi:hypothetical protein